jgi:glycosyltransferase involved in cell wall biosynthesis
MTSPLAVPVTAVVVSRNDAADLRECLPPLLRCDELTVVDLASTDDSRAVAAALGATVTEHELVPVVEHVYPEAVAAARNDWVLTTDPDERIPEALLDELARLVPALADDVGLVYAPLHYYFGERRLRGTIWGGLNRRRLLVHRRRAVIQPNVHAGIRLLPGYRRHEIAATPQNVVRHYWVGGWRDLLAKHRRYLGVEGESRYRNGEVTRWRDVLLAPWRGFVESFVVRRGYADGLLGFALSVFWGWYRTRALLALRIHQRRAS